MSGAAFTDLYKDKIYNLWVIPAFLIGIISAIIQGHDRVFDLVVTVATAFFILFPVYLLKGIAAGDIKLMMATASFLSFQDLLTCILISFLVAGAISLAVLIIKKNKKKTIHFAVPVMISALLVIGGVV